MPEEVKNNSQNENIGLGNLDNQIKATKLGTPIFVSPEIVAVWNKKRQMSSLELSTYTPFACVFLVMMPVFIDALKKKNQLSDLIYYRTKLVGYDERVLIPIGSTRGALEDSMEGTLLINNLEIGYEKTMSQLTGRMTFELNTLDIFEQNTIAISLLSPFNIFYIMYGWSGPDIWIDLPSDPNKIWETKVESLNPGWWGANTVYGYKRTFNPEGMGYTCDIDFMQNSPGYKGKNISDLAGRVNAFSEIKQHFVQNQEKINELYSDATKLASELNNTYKTCPENFNYVSDLIDKTWFSNTQEFKDKFSLKRKNEKGEEEIVSSNVIYPIGMVIEGIIATHFKINNDTTEPMLKMNYSKFQEPLKYTYSLYDGKEASTRELELNSVFDIPVSREFVRQAMATHGKKWFDLITTVISSVDQNYRLSFIGVDKVLKENDEDIHFNYILSMAESDIDLHIKEQSKKDRKSFTPSEIQEIVLDYRAPNSLIGEPRIEQSNVGLEKMTTPLIVQNLLNNKKVSTSDEEEDGNVIAEDEKTENKESRNFVFNANDAKKNDLGNTEIILRLINEDDDTPIRGFFIRSLAQQVSVDIHGLAGLFPMQLVWLRGMAAGMNGKYIILSSTNKVTPEGFITTLKLGNLMSGFDMDKIVTGDNSSDNSTTNDSDKQKTLSTDTKQKSREDGGAVAKTKVDRKTKSFGQAKLVK